MVRSNFLSLSIPKAKKPSLDTLTSFLSIVIFPLSSFAQEENETPAEVTETPSEEQQPVQCYPRDTLSAADLLPRDAASSPFAQVNPAGQGNSDGQNFLTAGSLIGIDTVGQSLRNANVQLRSEPPNPQVKVSPWMQTTIGPDMARRPLE